MGDAVDSWGADGDLAVAVLSGGEVVDKSCAGLLCVVGCHDVLRRMSLFVSGVGFVSASIFRIVASSSLGADAARAVGVEERVMVVSIRADRTD